MGPPCETPKASRLLCSGAKIKLRWEKKRMKNIQIGCIPDERPNELLVYMLVDSAEVLRHHVSLASSTWRAVLVEGSGYRPPTVPGRQI